MVTLIKRISLSELSEQALDQTLDKYSGAINGYSLSWTRCKICSEIDNNTDKNTLSSDECETLCPLYPSEWCRDDKLESRLYDAYAAMDTASFREKEYERWKTDVNNYLWWITTELELMRSDYEKHWSIGF